MEELHAAISAHLRQHRTISDVEREWQHLSLWRERCAVPRCQVCGRSIDDDGGCFTLTDMQLRRQCVEHYCPFWHSFFASLSILVGFPGRVFRPMVGFSWTTRPADLAL